jgi:hypothetical protein
MRLVFSWDEKFLLSDAGSSNRQCRIHCSDVDPLDLSDGRSAEMHVFDLSAD